MNRPRVVKRFVGSGKRILNSFSRTVSLLCAAVLLLAPPYAKAQEDTPAPDRKSEWNGFEQLHFTVANRAAYIVAPKAPATGNPWIWRARFPDYHAEMDIALLQSGFHIAYVDVAGMFGNQDSIDIGDEFYDYLRTNHDFAERSVLEGVSRGGLFVYNWAARNPEKVACIYCDTPVCDVRSWPGGKGTGAGSQPTWEQCLKMYGITEEQSESFDQNPIDHAEIIAAAGIPILHIVSENDRIVPPAENTFVLLDRMNQFGHPFEVIRVVEGTAESSGHHFTHPDPDRVVDFVLAHTVQDPGPPADFLTKARRIVFLGDSITYSGEYVAGFEAWLLTQELDPMPVVINVGLPSETVSGLSEDGHAGGSFPRPDLNERLDRVLATTTPDIVFACYGINCGIYQPLDSERLTAYRSGIENLKTKADRAGATLILITPPMWDDHGTETPVQYDTVMDRYANWLLANRQEGWRVIDLHQPMAEHVHKMRVENPDFTFQPDSVHANAAGHWFIASQMIGWIGDDTSNDDTSNDDTSNDDTSNTESPEAWLTAHDIPAEVWPLIRERMSVRRDAYLTAAQHERPGIAAGLPLDEAEQRADELTEQIRQLIEQ